MKASTKKRIVSWVVPVAWLVACYFIGRYVNMPGRSVPIGAVQGAEEPAGEVEARQGEAVPVEGEAASSEAGTASSETEGVPSEAAQAQAYSAEFHNEQTVGADQIPWGFTAGEIELEDGTSALLLTPGTSVTVEGAGGVEYCIHPWVAQASDGARLLLGRGADEPERQLDVTAEWSRCDLDGGTYDISLAPTENEDGDWVVLRLEAAEALAPAGRAAEGVFSILPFSAVMGEKAEYAIIEYSDDIVLDAGDGWDAVDVLNPSVVEIDDRYYNYYSGWDGQTWRTGLATSEDGMNWEKAEGFVLDVRPDAWDNTYIAANGCAVLMGESVFYYYQGVSDADGHARIGLAVSDDRATFDERTDRPVLDLGEDGSWDSCGVADPYVIRFGNKLYMYYLGMDSLSTQRLGVAVSEDGYNWTKYRNNPIMDTGVRGSFDENGLGEPCVIYSAPYFYMLYTGRNANEQRNLGVAVSRDGVNWKKLNHDGIIELANNSWDDQVICDPSAIENDDGTVSVWYGGGNVASPDQNLNGRIGVFKMTLGQDAGISSFDFNTWDSGDPGDYISGVYELDGETGNRYAWASDGVSIGLRNDAGSDTVVVRGYVNMEMYAQIDVNTLVLDFRIDGAEALSLELTESGSFEGRITKPSPIGRYFTLSIDASAYVNQKELGSGEDERNLSWILNSISQE